MTQMTAPAQIDFFLTDVDAAAAEVKKVAFPAAGDGEADIFDDFYRDAKMLFDGAYPGYRASNTKYHDFSHTVSVVLATARLVCGCRLDGLRFSDRQVLMTLTAALFHDVGLIQKSGDTEGSGAKYTIGHEERSIVFLRDYFSGKSFSDDEIETCGNLIRCTILSFNPSQIVFASDTLRTMGYIVGSADLLAQMADRLYLEKLLLLYKEFEEARIPGFDSELQLLQKTRDFYEIVAKKRLNDELGGVCAHMKSYFKACLNSDVDGYAEAISGNIGYLESLIALCRDCLRCYLENLKRGGITQPLIETLSPENIP